MADIVKRVTHYAAFRYPNRPTTRARINCYTVDGYRLYLIFKADGVALPSNSFNADIKTGVAYDSASHYADYVDLLRHEKPVWVTFKEDDATFVIYSASEQVGEGEI
jgi:hypothetical protein